MALTSKVEIGSDTLNFATKTSELENDSNFINQLKTINNQSIVGEGNITIEGGTGNIIDIEDMSVEERVDLYNNIATLILHNTYKYKGYILSSYSKGKYNSKPAIWFEYIVDPKISFSYYYKSNSTARTSMSGYSYSTVHILNDGSIDSSIVVNETFASSSYYSDHTQDNVAHCSQTEKDTWNGKTTMADVEAKGYLTEHQSLEGYATETWVEGKGYLTEHQSIKTVNGQSLVGTGNIEIEGGSSKIVPVAPTLDLSEPDEQVVEAYNSPNEYLLLSKESNSSSLVYGFYHQYDGWQLWCTYKHYGYTETPQYATDMVKLKVLPDGSYVKWGSEAVSYVYNNKIIIKQGDTEQTFTLNQSSDKTITLDSGFSGDYNDLTNKPTLNTEQWTFTLEDGTEITKEIYLK